MKWLVVLFCLITLAGSAYGLEFTGNMVYVELDGCMCTQYRLQLNPTEQHGVTGFIRVTPKSLIASWIDRDVKITGDIIDCVGCSALQATTIVAWNPQATSPTTWGAIKALFR